MKMLILAILMAVITILLAVVPLKLKRPYKILLGAVLLILCLKQQLIRLFGGPLFFAPDLPACLLLTSNWLYAATLLFFLLLLLSWSVLLIPGMIFYCRNKTLEPFRTLVRKLPPVLLIAAILLASYGMYCAMKAPAIKPLTFRHPQVPPSAENMRIAVLADLHIDNITCGERVSRIVAQTNALKPDLILILGDVVDGRLVKRQSDVQILKDLQARYGVYAVMGNHDCYSGYHEWMDFFRQINIKVLENCNVRLENDICLSGIPDPAARKQGVEVDLPLALQGIEVDAFNILLAHRPGVARELRGRQVDLQLSGHTHGGMIRLFDQLIGKFNGGFIAGWYELNDATLYVSSGSSIWNGFPIRLGRPSEITVITLKRN